MNVLSPKGSEPLDVLSSWQGTSLQGVLGANKNHENVGTPGGRWFSPVVPVSIRRSPRSGRRRLKLLGVGPEGPEGAMEEWKATFFF